MSTNKQAKGNELRFPSHVYVLTFEKWDNKRDTATEVIGVYSSKEAAVAVSGDVGTDHGTFDEAIEPDRGTFGEDYLHEDYRGNPPDNGVLIQFGGRDVFGGDYRRLHIRKMPLLGMSAVKKSPNKKRKANATVALPSSANKKQTAKKDLSSDGSF